MKSLLNIFCAKLQKKLAFSYYIRYNVIAVTWHTRKWEVAASNAGFSMENVRFIETGRQSHCKNGNTIWQVRGYYALFARVSVCAVKDYIFNPEAESVFGIIYEMPQNTRLSFKKMLSFYHRHKKIRRKHKWHRQTRK